MTHVAVIDIGKTNVKLALVERETLSEIAVVTRPNTVRPGPPWPHFDLDGHWRFLLAALRNSHTDYRVDAISITAHGASIVLLDADGGLAAPMLDYEHPGPDACAACYNRLRPPFAQTGSPRLAGGLNVGAQLDWMFDQDPDLRARTKTILTYPQYWSYRLSGIAATDPTSLGCHTDLWLPRDGRVSDLPGKLRIEGKLAPTRAPSEVLGNILPDVARQTGLPTDTPVICGIHDSNASLLPHLLSRPAPFSVVSTGTWIVVMSMGGAEVDLDANRDTLLNVNAMGQPVPSARFMGGREFELATASADAAPGPEAMASVLEEQTLLLPALVRETGPFAGRAGGWRAERPPAWADARHVAASFYCALVTSECLDLTGHRGDIMVEGPFSRNMAYMEMLAAATEAPVYATLGQTGTSQGAALLIDGPCPTPNAERVIVPEKRSEDMAAYAAVWRLGCRAG
ncbi:FGGY-family carbohydrate kinase [Gymnodinialimonas sp. 2305UL16-5]|uniref:FGGY-family carbohydrate kinase n=1 Tax=Gymnodinialimonas mytili TaxID=3126503 RepID=UPI00309F505B